MGRLSWGGAKCPWVNFNGYKYSVRDIKSINMIEATMSATMGRPVETGRKLKANTVQQLIETGCKLKANTVQQPVEKGCKLKANTVQRPVSATR